ncbi:MAG: peptide deformylase [Lachnospiraceae bacterium]|nr:peptide deformylase [Lachnospiraceae bacterium]
MALRAIRTYGDEILTMKSKPIKELKDRFKVLIDDMLDTMYDAGGVGLAAVQVGVLRRIVVIDISPEGDEPYVLINPEILETSGEQTGYEGCLSVPGKQGTVTRANYCKVKAFNRDMEEYIIEGEGLMARALQHEIDHLEGEVYVDKVEGELLDSAALAEMEDEDTEE